jgi:hypothetical protein
MPRGRPATAILLALALNFVGVPEIAARVGDCGQPASTGDRPTASDALAVLRAAVGTEACDLCTCDADGSGSVAATDALAVLRRAVGLAVPLACTACPGAVVPPAEMSLGAARGFVYQVNPVVVVDDPSRAPSGSVAVPGASVRAFEHDGDPLGETTSGSDGQFVIAALPTGYVRFEVRVNPASPDPDVVVEATIVPSITVALGRAFAIDREAAIEAALEGVDSSALVAGSMNPFPAETLVYPAGSSSFGAPRNADVHRLAKESWLFFVDLRPLADFAHPAQIVLVDAETGAVSRLPVEFPPVVNHGPLWVNRDDLFVFLPEPLPHLDPSDYPSGAEAVPTPELVQLSEFVEEPSPADDPNVFPAPLGDDVYQSIASISLDSTDPLVAASHFNNTGADGVFVVFIRTGAEMHYGQNIGRLAQRLINEGVPSGNMAKAEFTNHAPPQVDTSGVSGLSAADARNAAVTAQLRRAVLHFEPEIRRRLEEEGKHSTLVVYVTGHGGGGRMLIDYQNDDSGAWTFGASDFGIEETLACRVRVIIQSCGAGNLQDGLAAIFQGTEHDAVVMAASAGDRGASANPGWMTYVPIFNLLRRGGSHFTSRLASRVTVANGDLGSLIESGPGGAPRLIADLRDLDSMPPSPYVRPAHPSWCFPATGCGDGTISQPEQCDIGGENNDLACLHGQCLEDCTCDNACATQAECTTGDVCVFDRCTLGCDTPQGCPQGDTCSFLQSREGTVIAGCGPENTDGSPVGERCVSGADCRSWFCEGFLGECVAVCALGPGGNASCPGSVCVEFYFAQGVGLCGTSCANDADCGTGRVCRLLRDSESNLYRSGCFKRSEDRADVAEPCQANSQCNSSNCMTPPPVQSPCLNNADCGDEEYCTPFRRCALPLCTAHCVTNDDCPAQLPNCTDLDIPTPNGLSTQALAVCGP